MSNYGLKDLWEVDMYPDYGRVWTMVPIMFCVNNNCEKESTTRAGAAAEILLKFSFLICHSCFLFTCLHPRLDVSGEDVAYSIIRNGASIPTPVDLTCERQCL